jgi:hypothetical protein
LNKGCYPGQEIIARGLKSLSRLTPATPATPATVIEAEKPSFLSTLIGVKGSALRQVLMPFQQQVSSLSSLSAADNNNNSDMLVCYPPGSTLVNQAGNKQAN